MKNKIKPDKTFVGTWASCDPTQSSVKHRISISKNSFVVQAYDTYDGEKAEVRDVTWDGTYLRYNLHWTLTGRFSKNTLIVLAKDRAGLTFTFSDQMIFEKEHKKKKPNKTAQGKARKLASPGR